MVVKTKDVVCCAINLGAMKQVVITNNDKWECTLSNLPNLLGDMYFCGQNVFHLFGPEEILQGIKETTLAYCKHQFGVKHIQPTFYFN